jgi:hypothetical protein
MGLTAFADSLFTIVTTPTLTTLISRLWNAAAQPMAGSGLSWHEATAAGVQERRRYHQAILLPGRSPAGEHALRPVASLVASLSHWSGKARPPWPAALHSPRQGCLQTGFRCRISMDSGLASDSALPADAGQGRRRPSSHPVPAEARATTTMRLVAQLEHLSEVTESLTYRLLELEERLLAWDGPHQRPTDPARRSGGS